PRPPDEEPAAGARGYARRRDGDRSPALVPCTAARPGRSCRTGQGFVATPAGDNGKYMSRTVFCRKYQKEMPGLATAPYPGASGQDIFENVSQQDWQEWQQQQTMLINEKQLSMMNPEHHRYLQEQMDRFLNNEEHDAASGYVPPACVYPRA